MENEKQTYTAPELIELGDLHALTLGNATTGTDGGAASA
jgi:hypothetical protein